MPIVEFISPLQIAAPSSRQRILCGGVVAFTGRKQKTDDASLTLEVTWTINIICWCSVAYLQGSDWRVGSRFHENEVKKLRSLHLLQAGRCKFLPWFTKPGSHLALYEVHLQCWVKKVGPRLREFFRQVEADVVSNSRNKIHQTWDLAFSLYVIVILCLKSCKEARRAQSPR